MALAYQNGGQTGQFAQPNGNAPMQGNFDQPASPNSTDGKSEMMKTPVEITPQGGNWSMNDGDATTADDVLAKLRTQFGAPAAQPAPTMDPSMPPQTQAPTPAPQAMAPTNGVPLGMIGQQ